MGTLEMAASMPHPHQTNGRKTWSELQQAVKRSHRSALSVLNHNPHHFTFRHVETENGPSTRLYFLGVSIGHRENTLLFVDINHGSSNPDAVLPWKPLLDSILSAGSPSHMSKEEQLLRERKRLRSFGITSYDFNQSTSTFAFSACNSVFVCSDLTETGTVSNERLLPKEVKSSVSSGGRMDCKMCPDNPTLLAFIRDSDVWVANVDSLSETRLTFAHTGEGGVSEDPISAGAPSFVMQEEFDRYTGYWWQPKTTATDQERVYRILYEEVDESDVEIINIVSHDGVTSNIDNIRYPRAGTSNARSSLKLVEFQLDMEGNAQTVTECHLCDSLKTLFPNTEYLIRAGWTPDGKNVYAQLVDRRQKKLLLVLIPLDCFTSSSNTPLMDTDESQFCNKCYPQVIYEETTDIWLHIHDTLHFLQHENEGELSFIWGSERSGFLHLYLITTSVSFTNTDLPDAEGDGKPIVKETALTSGDWEVDGKQVWVDEKRKLVYFQANKGTPLESHLYVTTYVNPDTVVRRMTEAGFSHTVEMDKECSMFTTVYSSLQDPPIAKVFKLQPEGTSSEPICIATLIHQVERGQEAPELFTYPGEDGLCLHGLLFKPQSDSVSRLIEDSNGFTNRKYPILLFVYAGPQVQLVSNSFKGIRFLRLHTLASMGYAVVVVDSRGSYHRGLQFESHIRNRMGTVEVSDQVEALKWLADRTSYLDLARVAIHGWSYGGYMSLMGLAQRPDIFKIAIAGAPVTCWRLYDTGYTERYMDLPEKNPDGYNAGSVLQQVDCFPNEEKRLLIVHGLIDENVHFHHTSALIDALVKAGKPYELQVYPNERHGIRNPNSNEHYETMLLSFLQSNL